MAFDLFAGLTRLNDGDLRWYDNLAPEDQKAASTFVIARWLTGTSDPVQLVRLNTVVNPYLFSLGQEKSLLFKLMAAACTGSNKRHTWLKAPGAQSSTKLKLQVIMRYYELSAREGSMYIANVSNVDVLQMAEELGFDAEELKKLKKELA